MPETFPQKTFSGINWCLLPLAPSLVDDTDGALADIAKATGVRAELIVAANGVAWDTPIINRWVIERGGKWLPAVPGRPAIPGSPPGKGWAVFVAGNVIWIPNCEVTMGDDLDDEGNGNGAAALGWAALVAGLILVVTTSGKKPRAARRRRRRG